MLKRTVSAFIAVAILFLALWIDVATQLPVVETALLLILVFALYEIYRACGFIKKWFLTAIGFLFGILIFLSPQIIIDPTCLIIFTIIVMFVIAVTYHKRVSFSDICMLFFTTLYISFGVMFIKRIYSGEFGMQLVFVALISALLTDTGAYFSGYFFGKHKLIPEISPKKTVEGAVGGVIIAVLSLLVYAWILSFFEVETNLINIAITGFVSSIAAQFGDLSASMIKREYNIKDYGDIMPGHGGVLDRIDSLLFVAPLVFYLNLILPIFS